MYFQTYPASFDSAVSDSRSHSESGSIRSNDSHHRHRKAASGGKGVEHSDAESISLASHDSRGSSGKEQRSGRCSESGENEDEVVVLRKKSPSARSVTYLLSVQFKQK